MKKNQKASKENSTFTIGELNIILKIDFRDEDLEIKDKAENKSEKQYYKLKDLNEIKSLSFLDKREDILKRFQLKTNNEILKLLLIGSKNMAKQGLIDYVCFNIPKFEEEEEFFNDVLDSITKRYGIIFNKVPLSPNGSYSIKIEMSHKKEKNEINLGKDLVEEHETDNEIKGEGSSNPEDDYGNEEEEDVEDYEETEAMKKKLIPKFRRKNVLCNLYPQHNKYSMIYFNFDEFNNFPGKFSLDDMKELLEFFKKKNTVIFLNYYHQEEYVEEEEEKDIKKNNNEKIELTKEEEENINVYENLLNKILKAFNILYLCKSKTEFINLMREKGINQQNYEYNKIQPNKKTKSKKRARRSTLRFTHRKSIDDNEIKKNLEDESEEYDPSSYDPDKKILNKFLKEQKKEVDEFVKIKKLELRKPPADK